MALDLEASFRAYTGVVGHPPVRRAWVPSINQRLALAFVLAYWVSHITYDLVGSSGAATLFTVAGSWALGLFRPTLTDVELEVLERLRGPRLPQTPPSVVAFTTPIASRAALKWAADFSSALESLDSDTDEDAKALFEQELAQKTTRFL